MQNCVASVINLCNGLTLQFVRLLSFEFLLKAMTLIPKLFAAISAVYIVIRGLFLGSNQDQTTIEMNTEENCDTREEGLHGERSIKKTLMKIFKLFFLILRIIATLLFPWGSIMKHVEREHELIIIGAIIIMGAMNQIFLYCLNKKRLEWMLVCIMLSVFESISVVVLQQSYSTINFEFISIPQVYMVMSTMIFFNIPSIVGFSAGIYNLYQKNPATRLMGLILSTIGGIDVVICLMPMLWHQNIVLSITILCFKVIGLVTNQIIVRNVSDKRILVFWIAITTLDCIFAFVLFSFAKRRSYHNKVNVIGVMFLIPKLFTSISAVYIVIKGLFSGSSRNQTLIEMNTI